ncbi:MAG: low-complexity tail membrane protein [Cyanobacteria bacterium J06559_3]
MTSLRRDPYLWTQLVGLATLPLWLDICLAGLAVGDPTVPPWLELSTLALIGSVPCLWMQWQRPFYPFSLLAIALRPDALDEDRQRLLSLQRTWPSRPLSLLNAIGLFLILVLLYQMAPIAAPMSPFTGTSRAVGWFICAFSFLLANFFGQVAVAVLPLLPSSDHRLQTTQPYAPADVLTDFTVPIIRVSRLLPELAEASSADAAITPDAVSPAYTSSETAAQGTSPLPEIGAAEQNPSVAIEPSSPQTDIPSILDTTYTPSVNTHDTASIATATVDTDSTVDIVEKAAHAAEHADTTEHAEKTAHHIDSAQATSNREAPATTDSSTTNIVSETDTVPETADAN